MNRQTGIAFCRAVILTAVTLFTAHAQTAPFSKAQVADRIRKVEDGVDEFNKYLENRGDDAKSRADSAQSSEATTRRQRSSSANTQARGDQVKQTKDDFEDAMDDLNRTTNACAVSSIPHKIIWRPRRKWNRSWTARAASIRSWLRGIMALRRNDTGLLCAQILMI
jgi:hypothetical protein